jgi:hypothetical protein
LITLWNFVLVEIRPFDDLDHLGDHGARQIARLGQLQPIGLNCTWEQDRARRLRQSGAPYPVTPPGSNQNLSRINSLRVSLIKSSA